MKLTHLLAAALLSLSFAEGYAQMGVEEQTHPNWVYARLEPGDSHCNYDGVCAYNFTGSGGDMVLRPKYGGPGSPSKVTAGNGVHGAVEGIDSNDTVSLGGNSTVTVTGDGGAVSSGFGCTVTVTNYAPAGGDAITFTMPGTGEVKFVNPGHTHTFYTN